MGPLVAEDPVSILRTKEFRMPSIYDRLRAIDELQAAAREVNQVNPQRDGPAGDMFSWVTTTVGTTAVPYNLTPMTMTMSGRTRRPTVRAQPPAKPLKVHKAKSFGNWFRQLEAKEKIEVNLPPVVTPKPRVRRAASRVAILDDLNLGV